MKRAEVERFEGVERGLMGLLRLWKCGKKLELGMSEEYRFARDKTANVNQLSSMLRIFT